MRYFLISYIADTGTSAGHSSGNISHRGDFPNINDLQKTILNGDHKGAIVTNIYEFKNESDYIQFFGYDNNSDNDSETIEYNNWLNDIDKLLIKNFDLSINDIDSDKINLKQIYKSEISIKESIKQIIKNGIK